MTFEEWLDMCPVPSEYLYDEDGEVVFVFHFKDYYQSHYTKAGLTA